jgi:ParB/RepB/Spo0J family partition protein
MIAREQDKVELIPIEQINVVNPRTRGKAKFKQIVDNIAQLGLKKPITVARRSAPLGSYLYDLVCGQGRLEACRSNGATSIPALVINATREELLLASLVENLARKRNTTVDLAKEIAAMKDRGASFEEIARRTDLHVSYVRGIIRLLKKGENKLLRAVEQGQIPISIAITIACSDGGRRSDRKVVPDNGTGPVSRRIPGEVHGLPGLPDPLAHITGQIAHAAGRLVRDDQSPRQIPVPVLMDHHAPFKGMDRHKESPRLNVPFPNVKAPRQIGVVANHVESPRQIDMPVLVIDRVGPGQVRVITHMDPPRIIRLRADEHAPWAIALGGVHHADPPWAIRLGLLPDLDSPRKVGVWIDPQPPRQIGVSILEHRAGGSGKFEAVNAGGGEALG